MDFTFPKIKNSVKNIWGNFLLSFYHWREFDGLTFDSAKDRFIQLIGNEAHRFHFLLESDKLTEDDKNIYRALISLQDGKYMMEEVFISAIKTLSRLLSIHYEKKAIILIDEYDVPLDKAFTHGYYKEMVSLEKH